ncbi:hypothetical protein BpHYR1_037357 [Brachionus plicatilis]|uniref:Uncharacterized protein n=1 Tax=Brachionus plicatilis TaxID=10195 RepID=A0A3M7PH16_BRAPC|nr:hypothetical protein BpHYR1_037357 [Brachionus plicatilis]
MFNHLQWQIENLTLTTLNHYLNLVSLTLKQIIDKNNLRFQTRFLLLNILKHFKSKKNNNNRTKDKKNLLTCNDDKKFISLPTMQHNPTKKQKSFNSIYPNLDFKIFLIYT